MRQQEKNVFTLQRKSFSRELRGLNPNFHIPVSESDLYLPGSVAYFPAAG